jgi:dolichol-phosphate mannosyltransferase
MPAIAAACLAVIGVPVNTSEKLAALVAVTLLVLFAASGGQFLFSQGLATWIALTSNFFLNNAFTYADRLLRGARMWRGLLGFYVACSVGALINVAVAEWLYTLSVVYWAAGLAGALLAAIWNFLTTASVIWGERDEKNA